MAINYRADIDGLRAVAVLSVVAEHTGRQFIQYGRFGVDVFFVISGYIITSIILAELEAENFSLMDFYLRRVRRILPALIALVSFVLPLAIILRPELLTQFLNMGLAALMSASNFYYILNPVADLPSGAAPLVHTWSLSIEEQFYLIYPALLILLWSRMGRHGGWVLFGLAAISLSLFLGSLRTSSGINQMQPHLRAWELLIGTGLAHLRFGLQLSNRSALALGVAGTCLLVIGLTGAMRVVALSPTISTLFAIGGTGALLSSGERSTLVGAVLGSRLVVAIGVISYSLYLWHWSLFELFRLALNRNYDLGPKSASLLVVCALLAATASYYLVEQPFRLGRRATMTRATLVWFGLTIGLLLIAKLAIVMGG